MSDMAFEVGTRIRTVTIGELGSWADFPPKDVQKFDGPMISSGTTGRVIAPSKEEWLIVRFDTDETAFSPVHPSMIEAAPE